MVMIIYCIDYLLVEDMIDILLYVMYDIATTIARFIHRSLCSICLYIYHQGKFRQSTTVAGMYKHHT